MANPNESGTKSDRAILTTTHTTSEVNVIPTRMLTSDVGLAAWGNPLRCGRVSRLADYMAEQTGIRATYETVRLVLKADGIVLSRPQHTISSPDPEYKLKKRRLKKPVTG